MKIGERIVKHRRKLGMTQHWLAAKTGIQEIRLSRIERGKVKIRPEELPLLAKALHVESI